MSADPYADLQRLGPEKVRWLVESGHYANQDAEAKHRRAVADKRWQAAGKALKQHHRKKR